MYNNLEPKSTYVYSLFHMYVILSKKKLAALNVLPY